MAGVVCWCRFKRHRLACVLALHRRCNTGHGLGWDYCVGVVLHDRARMTKACGDAGFFYVCDFK